jgi:uncharacterized protein YecE (DUF72 family)
LIRDAPQYAERRRFEGSTLLNALGTADERTVRVGTAGWAIPAPLRETFPGEGSRLERYARRFTCVEINSSFYRPHRPATYARWAASVPDDFRFALKVPKEITHARRFVDCAEPLERFLTESAELGEKRGVLLVQLPPSFAHDPTLANAFFTAFRERYVGLLACEPRHPTWFTEEAETALRAFRIARVAADPAVVPGASDPGGWDGFVYYRLHGSPRVYYSSYENDALGAIVRRLCAAPVPAWCVFDNTAMDAATANALDVVEMLRASARG